jgi:cell wall-associated NlpC family hydrolase
MPLLVGGVAAVLLVAVIFGGALASVDGHAFPSLCTTNTAAASDIPPAYLALYEQAGAHYGVPWPVLAAIGKVESDHGRSHEPGISSGANFAGAMGPMQFLASTWTEYGQGGNVYEPEDAIPAAARLLKANGAPGDLKKAIFAYNHADWYVTKVLNQAAAYAGGQDLSDSDPAGEGCEASIVPPDQAAATVIAFARAQLGKPYVWGAAGPDAYDCSGLTMAAYKQIGIHLPHNAADQWNTLPHIPANQAQPGDLVFFVTDGSPTAPGHVGIYLGNDQMIEAPNHTAPVRISTINRPDLVGFAKIPH